MGVAIPVAFIIMKYLFISILIFPSILWSAEKEFERSIFSISFEQWSQPLYLKSYGTQDKDVANFRGLSLGVVQSISYAKWGWSYGVGYSQGNANGGGNSRLLAYQLGQQKWSKLQADSLFFYKVNPRIGLGIQFILSALQISWPEDQLNFITADNGNTLNVSALIHLNLRLTQNLDLIQALGFYSLSESSALTKIGIGYSW